MEAIRPSAKARRRRPRPLPSLGLLVASTVLAGAAALQAPTSPAVFSDGRYCGQASACPNRSRGGPLHLLRDDGAEDQGGENPQRDVMGRLSRRRGDRIGGLHDHDEPAGVASYFRRRPRIRKRRLVREKWDELRAAAASRRRRRLAGRLSRSSGALRSIEEQVGVVDRLDRRIDKGVGNSGGDGGEITDFDEPSVDAARAKIGVLRTRIRLRREALAELERLIAEVKTELRRAAWQGKGGKDSEYTRRTSFLYGQPTAWELSNPTATVTPSDELDNAGDIDVMMNEQRLLALNEDWKRSRIRLSSEATENEEAERRKEQDDEGLRRIFNRYRRTSPDYLTASDISDLVGGEAQAKRIIELVDNNGDGRIDFAEFSSMMTANWEKARSVGGDGPDGDGRGGDIDDEQLSLMQRRRLDVQNSILQDRIRLQRLERAILCLEDDAPPDEGGIIATSYAVAERQAKKFVNTFGLSTSVLLRKLDRVSSRTGRNNRDYGSVRDYVVEMSAAGLRIVTDLARNPGQLAYVVDPDVPALVPHIPAILGRLDRLESHVTPILSGVLNNKRHLRSIEPYLDVILERFDDIEPHLPWILEHIDTLAPYTGLLLRHIDELLLYAAVDEYEAEADGSDGKGNYAFAEQLLPYLEVYVSQLDLVGPHLPLLRPHLPLLLKHNRIRILSPHVGALFAKGYKDLSGEWDASASICWSIGTRCLTKLGHKNSPVILSWLTSKQRRRTWIYSSSTSDGPFGYPSCRASSSRCPVRLDSSRF